MRAKILLLSLLATGFPVNAENWFADSTPLNSAHQKLLDNDLQGSFASMIQVWQTDTDSYVKSHLNDLLLKALESDCGKSIVKEPIAPWIHSITVKRQAIQSPGRQVSRLIIDVTSAEGISGIKFTAWPEESVSDESSFETIEGSSRSTYRLSYELGQRLESGLYRLAVTSEQGEAWDTWIVMGETPAKRIVRWDSQDSWAVDKLGLLNPYCALPELTVSLYDFIDNEYVRVWHKTYESNYPGKLPIRELKPERYVLAVGITHQRWQGPLVIQDQQVISKTYDISSE